MEQKRPGALTKADRSTKPYAVAKPDRRALFAGYPLWRRGLIYAFIPVEWLFTRIYHVTDVNDMFRVSPSMWHHGARRDAAGQVVIDDGAAVLDLHFQNATLLTLAAPRDHRVLIRGLRDARQGLGDIAQLLDTPAYAHVRGLTAYTLIHRGIDLLGFHVETPPERRETKRLQTYMRFLMGMYHPEGFHRLRQGRQPLALKLVWMTREELVNRYKSESLSQRR